MERRSALSVGGVHISTLRDEVRHDLRVPGVCCSIYERRPAVLIRLIDIQTLLHGLANRDDPCARACRAALPPLRSVPVAAHEARGHAVAVALVPTSERNRETCRGGSTGHAFAECLMTKCINVILLCA